jgi:hypothetical protein
VRLAKHRIASRPLAMTGLATTFDDAIGTSIGETDQINGLAYSSGRRDPG